MQCNPSRRSARSWCGLPGDRRNEDLIATFEASRPFVDEYILHDLEIDQRGRAKHEVPKMLQARLPEGCPSMIVDTQDEAIMQAWKRLEPGDRLVVVADLVEKSLETLRLLAESIASDSKCTAPLSTYVTQNHH
jgi:cyanophycin synthetase